MVNDRNQDSLREPAKQGVRDVPPEPDKIGASTPNSCPASTTFPGQRQLLFPPGLIFCSPSDRRRRDGRQPGRRSEGFLQTAHNRRRKSGEPAFGFPQFPQARHFHSALPLLALLLLLSLFHPVARNVQF
jgi:hypothetical protein